MHTPTSNLRLKTAKTKKTAVTPSKKQPNASTQPTVPAPAKPAKREKKPHRGIHPPEVAQYRPLKSLSIPTPNDATAYGTLTDESLYSEYAWAFLRRNRYYQQLIDRNTTFPLTHWGYRPSPDHDFGHGLDREKNYFEPFAKGTSPQWHGIYSFEHHLIELTSLRRNRNASMREIEYPSQQVAVVFDLAPLLGEGSSVLGIQLDRARALLQKMRPGQGISTKRAKGPSKQLLRSQLRIADLLSSPEELAIAREANPNSLAANQQKAALKNLELTYKPANSLGMSDIVDLIPSFDLKRSSLDTAKIGPTKEQRLKRVSELAVSAWRNMYCWDLLNWLQYDDWTGKDLNAPKVVLTKTISKNG